MEQKSKLPVAIIVISTCVLSEHRCLNHFSVTPTTSPPTLPTLPSGADLAPTIRTEGILRAGGSYNLTCEVDKRYSTYTPTYLCRRNNVNITEGRDVLGVTSETLRLLHLMEAHSGQYTCEATVGDDHFTSPMGVTISIEGKTASYMPVLEYIPSNLATVKARLEWGDFSG